LSEHMRGLARTPRSALLAAVLLAVWAVPAYAAPGATSAPPAMTPPELDSPFPSDETDARLTERRAVARLLTVSKVARWLDRYPSDPTTDASYEGDKGEWEVHVWSGGAGEIARGRVADATGVVVEAWTGPQVAWKMARGRPGAFGGKVLNRWEVWVALSLVFVLGLADLRRLRSLGNLDLLALVAFGISLAFFNRGEIFRSVPLAYPPLLYLLARCCQVGFRRTGAAVRSVWPVWLLAAVALFLGGFRIGLNLESPRGVIDVGYAGVIGADRILDGRAPYGNMPVQDDLEPCGPADSDGEIRQRIQDDGRCEASNARGDTYGPVAYLAYVPAVAVFGWSGKWDSLPAAHATAIGLDALVVLGLLLVGHRLGGARIAVTLAFAWLAYPFTSYALNANTNDALMPAFLVWGFWLATSPWARGATVAAAGWTKFAALLLAPLWLTYPSGISRAAGARFLAAFAAVSVAAFSILLLEPDLVDAGRTFLDRTIGFQLGRHSPFSLWDWGQYHARGIPDLGIAQIAVQVATLALAGFAAARPARKGPIELAALTAAILLAFQASLTHWFYLYLPWVLPFVVAALVLPRVRADEPG
jgi:hypothetical protein